MKIALKGNPVNTSGTLPAKGSQAPDFKLVRTDLSEARLADFGGKKKVLNVFPSVDTGTCAMSVRRFNKEAAALKDVAVLNISMDLPFAMKRFCGAEGIENTESLSAFRSPFATDYGLKMTDGPLAGLCSRAVIVLDGENRVAYTQQVAEITEEPDYAAALNALK